MIVKQILESGSPAALSFFNAYQREPAWQTFVSDVPSCTQSATTGHTLDCLRRANSSDIAQGLRINLGDPPQLFPLFFDPTLDGPNGLIPDYPSKLLAEGRFACVPFIAGTNLDEGEELVIFFLKPYLIHSSGTLFTPTRINSEEEVSKRILSNSSPLIVAPSAFDDVARNILGLYPDIPALGSPFHTGNETFGLSSVYKQAAAIR